MTDDIEDGMNKLVAEWNLEDFVLNFESDNRLRHRIQKGLDDVTAGQFSKKSVADIAEEVRTTARFMTSFEKAKGTCLQH